MRLSHIAIHPIKAARAISLSSSRVFFRGLDEDRLWMIVRPNGRFITQREDPRLATLIVEPTSTGLRLDIPGHGSVSVATPNTSAPTITVTVWQAMVKARPAIEASKALSAWLGEPVDLVRLDDEARRDVNPSWSKPGDYVSFADAFPILVTTQASLDALNAELSTAIPMSRFRPNLVIEGSDAWADDSWRRIRIGDVELDLVKPCDRCVVTTTDQLTGERTGDEPIRTLRRLRWSNDRRVVGVLFGWNAIPRRLGTVKVGDPVEVIQSGARWPIADPRG